MFCSGLVLCSSFDPSVVPTVPENNTVVCGAAARLNQYSCVYARPVATRRMMNNCEMAWFKNTKLALDIRVTGNQVLSAYLELANRQEA
jgi:hypothetical protein